MATSTQVLTDCTLCYHDALKAEAPEPVAEMGLAIGEKYGLTSGDDIVIESNRGSIKMKVALDERVA